MSSRAQKDYFEPEETSPRRYSPELPASSEMKLVSESASLGTESGCSAPVSDANNKKTLLKRKAGLELTAIDRHSPLFAYVRPGDRLVSINDEPVRDTIDFHFKMAEPEVDLLFELADGEQTLFEFEDVTVEELGLTLKQSGIRTCKNECIFCFVMQQPKGMRRSLYIMDEDYRYSFTHGNFVTLSNTTDADIARIIEQRLSPMYISVHATNDTLRRCMLKNELLAPILPRLKELIAGGIVIHAQVVLCPGINDGPELERTISELAALNPGIETLALAPVGLTKYRDNLPDISIYSQTLANDFINRIEKLQKGFLKDFGTRFVWPADEFYTIAKRRFPALKEYEDIAQFENGIGMCRLFAATFNRKKQFFKRSFNKLPNSIRAKKPRLVGFTGESAIDWLQEEIVPQVREMGIDLSFNSVKNEFWGGTVTISGLLSGADLLQAVLKDSVQGDIVLLPPNCLNNDDLFIDNLTLEEFCKKAKRTVVVGSYDFVETLKEALSLEVKSGSCTLNNSNTTRGNRSVALAEAGLAL